MLTGTTSMEMLVDTGYTLAHNGGPIFNKGMMYTHYDSHFLTILDLQRAGQMLDLLTGTNLHVLSHTGQWQPIVDVHRNGVQIGRASCRERV